MVAFYGTGLTPVRGDQGDKLRSRANNSLGVMIAALRNDDVAR